MRKMKQMEYDAPEISVLMMEMNDVLCDSTATSAGIEDLTEGSFEW